MYHTKPKPQPPTAFTRAQPNKDDATSRRAPSPPVAVAGVVFGVPLAQLLQRDKEKRQWLQIPFFLHKAFQYLTVYGLSLPGIFKSAGSGPEVARYQSQIDAGGEVDFEDVEDVNTVSSLLKTYLRRLPDALLCCELYAKWMKVAETTDPVQYLQAVNDLIRKLPVINQSVLAELMKLMYMIDQTSETSKMDAGTLSTLLSQNLLWKAEDREQAESLDKVVRLNDIIRFMILEYPLLFENATIPVSAKPEVAKFASFKRKFLGHKKSISSVEKLWDGRQVWSADSAGTIRVWDSEELRFVREIETGQGRILCLKSIGPHVWCGSEKSLQIRDERGVLVKEVQGGVFAIASARQGKHVWTAAENKMKIYDVQTLQSVAEVPLSTLVLSMTVDGDNVWAACTDKKIRIWNSQNNALIKEIEAHNRKVNFITTGRGVIYSCSDDKSVCSWDAKTFNRLKREKLHSGYVYSLVWSGQHLWSASWDKKILIWDTDCGNVGKLKGYHSDAVSATLLVYNRRLSEWNLWSGSFDKSICVWTLGKDICTLATSSAVLPTDSSTLSATSQFHLTSMPSSDDLLVSVAGGSSSMARTVSASRSMSSRSMASSHALHERDAYREKTGLDRWEIDSALIQNPGNSLGTGSFGTVFKAELHGKIVAVKKLSTQKFDDKTLEDFRKEVAIMSTLRHPNVLLFMGACTQPGNLLIVTELMPRGSVYDLLRDKRVKLSFKRKMLIAKDAALGVNWLHRSKPQFLHLDLKAANLLVDNNWVVKVADFGLSVVKQDAAAKKEKHGPIGTPLWMAPEVLMNKEYDEKADVYSFGIVLWEILTGEDPWGDIESLVDLVDAVCLEHRRPPLPRDIPESLRDLINACWHPETDKRPSFEEIIPRFDDIIVDGIIGDPLGRGMWRQYFLGKTSVTWREFVEAFAKLLKIPLPKDPRDIKFQCLRKVVTSEKELDKVSIENFARMLDWFGPLNEAGVMDRIYELLKKPYFHGNISTQDAERVMAQQKKGTFLLRFSSRDPGCYALTVLNNQGSLKHYRIMHSPGSKYSIGKVECSSLDSLIKRYHKELSLKRPCPNSPYEAMFIAFERDQVSVGYQDMDC